MFTLKFYFRNYFLFCIASVVELLPHRLQELISQVGPREKKFTLEDISKILTKALELKEEEYIEKKNEELTGFSVALCFRLHIFRTCFIIAF